MCYWDTMLSTQVRAARLVLECLKGSYLEGGACQTGEKFGFFQGVNMDEID